MDDDFRDHLLRISVRHQLPIIELLLDIQQEKEQRTEASFKFLGELECFRVGPGNSEKIKLFRHWIKALRDPNYVALSYTWSPSKGEQSTKGRYLVQNRKRSRFYSSGVRDCVLDRITKYMEHKNVQFLWIDRHSIPQPTCKDPQCECRPCKKKAAALHSMDWVYKKSKHPVALLGRPINETYELDLLHQILERKCGDGSQSMVFGDCQEWERKALKLLYEITSDLWWQRAWTFQENYKGGMKMILLISHPPPLEEQKRKLELFGDVPGELCIESILLFQKATHLCQKLKNRNTMPAAAEMIDWILSKAGRYNELLQRSEPMDPAIIADTERRGVKEPWDRLSIVANCCDYPFRLNEQQLRHNGSSLSLSVLAMCLLNGLILHNGTNNSISKMSVSEFLKVQSFNKFYSPPEQPNLTFNKGCRFVDVELSKVGVGTKGHLWELGLVINGVKSNSQRQLPRVESTRVGLSLPAQERLTQLSHKLKSLSQETLASHIESYLRGDTVGNDPFRFVGDYMRMMAEAVADAIERGKALRLGSLWDPERENVPCTAIFVWQDAGKKGSDDKRAFAFTSSQPKETGMDGYYVNDTDRHVSLEVCLAKNLANGSVPCLYTKRWLLGLCFFAGCSRKEVVFPWPQALIDIKPDL